MLPRRSFLSCATAAAVAGCAGKVAPRGPRPPLFEISLAQWSLVKSFRDRTLDHLQFAEVAARNGYEGIEYVNQFFMDRATDLAYLDEMKRRAADAGVPSVLIMCDNEGRLGDPDASARTRAVENHYKWVEAARRLGCHAIRVNAGSAGTWDEQRALVADGLRRLAEFGAAHDIHVLVENHGGLSSNGRWLAEVMREVAHPRCGTLPDFGNFKVSDTESYDSYQGVAELMPFARGVSVKDKGWDAAMNRVDIDFERMMRIVLAAGFRGYCGVEYGGLEGIRAARDRLAAVRERLAAEFS